MEVLLIGSGAVGAVVARHLTDEPGADSVRIGDIDPKQAKEVAARTRSPKAQPLTLDAGNEQEVVKAMKGADLVINASLPRFNEGILEAALRQGVHYLDLAWWDDRLLERDADFQEADLIGIVGCGEDPGVSNVLAKATTDGMEVVDLLRIIDAETATSEDYPFACLFSPVTFLAEALGPAAYYEDGQLRELPPFSGEELYDFPGPVGRVPVYFMDHEEVRTLPRFLGPRIRRAEFKLALDPDALTVLKAIHALGLMTLTPVLVDGTPVIPRNLLLQLIPPPDTLRGKVKGFAALAVEAQGRTAQGTRRRRGYTYLSHEEAYARYGATGTAYLTGTGAAVAALMILRGKVSRRGVLSPELLDTEPFLEILTEKGVQVHFEETRESER